MRYDCFFEDAQWTAENFGAFVPFATEESRDHAEEHAQQEEDNRRWEKQVETPSLTQNPEGEVEGGKRAFGRDPRGVDHSLREGDVAAVMPTKSAPGINSRTDAL